VGAGFVRVDALRRLSRANRALVQRGHDIVMSRAQHRGVQRYLMPDALAEMCAVACNTVLYTPRPGGVGSDANEFECRNCRG
jgi:hypothetical protein